MAPYNYEPINVPEYSVLPSDSYLGIEYTGDVTLTLPNIEQNGSMCFVITDISGNASTNNITIQTSEQDTTISGNSILILSKDYESVTIFNNYYYGNESIRSKILRKLKLKNSTNNFNWFISSRN